MACVWLGLLAFAIAVAAQHVLGSLEPCADLHCGTDMLCALDVLAAYCSAATRELRSEYASDSAWFPALSRDFAGVFAA
jgi:hypothetical protein